MKCVLIFVAVTCLVLAEAAIKGPCACTKEYWPVCGTDGNTHSNMCQLQCEAYETKNAELKYAKDGPCNANQD